MYTEKDYNDSLCHHGVKGQKWGVRHFQNQDGSYTNAGMKRYGYDGSRDGGPRSFKGNMHRALAKANEINSNYWGKNNRNSTLASMQRAKRDRQLKLAEQADSRKAKRAEEHRSKNSEKQGIRQTARSNFAKAVGNTYKINEYVENKKADAFGKASKAPIVGKFASKKENTAKENAKFYKQTRDDLTSGKVAPARTKYQKFIRAAFFKNPAGRAYTMRSIKTSPYLKTGQQKATAIAEMGLMKNYYDEQKKLKKAGKAYNKY